MLRRNIADKLYSLVIKRYQEVQRELSSTEKDRIWYAIYGRLCHGESEAVVEEWCKTAPLSL